MFCHENQVYPYHKVVVWVCQREEQIYNKSHALVDLTPNTCTATEEVMRLKFQTPCMPGSLLPPTHKVVMVVVNWIYIHSGGLRAAHRTKSEHKTQNIYRNQNKNKWLLLCKVYSVQQIVVQSSDIMVLFPHQQALDWLLSHLADTGISLACQAVIGGSWVFPWAHQVWGSGLFCSVFLCW